MMEDRVRRSLPALDLNVGKMRGLKLKIGFVNVNSVENSEWVI
jgi:hypothetical protein